MKYRLMIAALFGLSLTGCVGNMNPTGGNSSPNYPYYKTREARIVKKIQVPVGTTLVYETQFLKEGEQDKIMSEDKLTDIRFPQDQPMMWGGVPISMISKFFNSEMHGFSVYADFQQLDAKQHSRFAQLWQSCDDDLGITVKDTTDWSFNKANIADVESCSVNYQRYFKDNQKQQQFLDTLYREMMKAE
ncbi:hypothetical protein F971_02900 [Acinetobacter vivianii]|uniref:Lipoprotein n=1 Tax=Acinetobacter vivianii TaxID=1776742 RepID=N8W4P2_9GAMM|nr:hypothetical protein [Acinetobacter vivianii]ENU91808.1 hypothetical protein F971_02900 [Acinetobacter vivianii]